MGKSEVVWKIEDVDEVMKRSGFGRGRGQKIWVGLLRRYAPCNGGGREA